MYLINFNCHLTHSAPTFPTSPNTSPLPFTRGPLARYESLGKGRPRSRSAWGGERILRGRGEGPARGGGPPALHPPGLPPDRCPLRRAGAGERVPRPAPRPPGRQLRRGGREPLGGNNPPSGLMPPRSTILLSRATPSHPPVLKWRAGKEDGRTSTETFFLFAYTPFLGFLSHSVSPQFPPSIFLKGFPCESRKNIARVRIDSHACPPPGTRGPQGAAPEELYALNGEYRRRYDQYYPPAPPERVTW